MKIEKRTAQYYEIKSLDGAYGLCGTFHNEEQALVEINRSYESAKEKGYDDRNDRWIIVCVERTVERDENGYFLSETTKRFAVADVEFSEYEECFVFVY